ncbi:SitI3 family protein [Micromonospora sp. WMMD1120]|uniref:SitI3 family protein n=1 Tax=Micromonospora sp. WMMD1120 TaxID=3016106 RepID=UPI002417B96E|nr:SitI3 family protein [Micromonospora sp. WMMD1120]MDG4807185.1 SitI3 family protein [Micromonospora sp. WMMD1120]
MGIEYRLTLAGDIPLEDLAPLVAPHGVEESTQPGYPRLLSADLREELGYTVTIYAGSNGYFDAEDDDGTQWEWEPDAYASVAFDLRKNDPPEGAVPSMVSAVARVLAGRPEDAALVLNGNWLLLTRVAGELREHRSSWWDTYGVRNMIVQ